MARAYSINGETLVKVDGNELGLTDKNGVVTITPVFKYDDIDVDAWGMGIPEIQYMLAEVQISMTLVHLDRSYIDYCMLKAMGGPSAIGQTARAGTLMGANGNLIVLGLTSPVLGVPWRFPYAHLNSPPISIPLGTKRSLMQLNWRAIPYTVDPYNGGNGAQNSVIWDYTAT